MVLLYEPDRDLAPLFCFLLEHLGRTVHLATTLDEIPPILQAHAPALAVVRPEAGVDGWAVCRQIQTRLGAPVICLLPPNSAAEHTADLHVLPLPVDPGELRAVVNSFPPSS
jgi:DNA-binding response OmpR family regulator